MRIFFASSLNLVLDTNVLIAAFLTKGVCHDLLEHCQREHWLVTSTFILAEFEEKLHDKFKIPEDSIQQSVALLRSCMQVVTPRYPALSAVTQMTTGYLELH
jgi:predicted nucleic acid-binding protein